MTKNPHDPLSCQGRLFFARPSDSAIDLSNAVLLPTADGDWIFAAKELAKEILRVRKALDELYD